MARPQQPPTATRLAYLQVATAVKLGPAPGPGRIRDAFESPDFDITITGETVRIEERVRDGRPVPPTSPAWLVVPMSAVVAYRELA